MEYGITTKPITLENPMFNAVLERIHQVLGNLVRTFNISTQTQVDENYPWKVILAAVEFEIFPTSNRQQGYSPGKLIFDRDMILPVKYKAGQDLNYQQKQTQINKDKIQNKYNSRIKLEIN